MTARDRIVGRIALAVASILLVLLVLEITLRWWPTLLGYSFAIDTAPLFAGPSFLPNDGHLSPHGSRVMADLIAAAIEARADRPSPRPPDRREGVRVDRSTPRARP